MYPGSIVADLIADGSLLQCLHDFLIFFSFYALQSGVWSQM